jgi:CheY-like chemotaxis protein
LVDLHGGTVGAASEGPNRGSEFTVRLPALDAAQADTAPAAQDGGAAALAPARNGRRVLLVDDNVDAAELLGRWLAEMGHEVKVLHDPAQALQAAAGFAPEVALLDIGLPVIDGYELAQRLREVLRGQPPCRLVALSGYGQEGDRARSQAAGFELHLVKPVQPQALLQLLQEG